MINPLVYGYIQLCTNILKNVLQLEYKVCVNLGQEIFDNFPFNRQSNR